MTESPPVSPSSARGQSRHGPSLRVWGILLLLMFILTSAVGGSLALESSYLIVTLSSHIGLALLTVGLAGYVSGVVSRPYKSRARASARLAGISAGFAAIAGAVFLWLGSSDLALYAMEGFAILGIVASLLMIAFGARSERLPAAETVA